MKRLEVNNQKILSNRNRNLQSYFKDLSKINKTDKKDNEKTKDQLVSDNLLFVVSVAKQYQNLGLPIEDLISEGNIGLMEASEKFNGSMGNKFISYAVWWIRRRILDYVNKNKRIIRVTHHNIRQLEQVRVAEDNLIKKLDRLPSLDEIYVELKEKINKDRIANLIELNLLNYSFDYTDNSEERYSLEERISNGDFEETEEDNREVELNRKVSVILDFVESRFKSKPVYKDVIIVYFGLEGSQFKTLEEVGEHYKLSKRQLVRLLKVVLWRIKCRFKLGFVTQLKDII